MVLNDLRENKTTSVDQSKYNVNSQFSSSTTNNTSSTSTATPSTPSTPTTTSTSTSTPSTTSTSTSTPQPSTTSNTSSTPSVYDTNDNNIYNFPLLHGGNGNLENSFSNFFKNFNLTPGVLIIFLVVIIVFVLLFTSLSSLGKNNSGDSSSSSGSSDSNGSTSSTGGSKSHIITIIIIVVIVITISFLYRKFENTTIIASIKKLFTRNPQVNLTASKTPPLPMSQSTGPPKEVPEIKLYKEVFNIPGNNYTYSQAQSICSAYDAKLATYDELEDAYVRGAEWCNYGWSEGQMALFPTQKKTFNTLQTIKGHEHDCGRPGINGGYMANPNVRYGVNCYGNKPRRTEIEKELMENTSPYPLTKEEMLMEKQVEYWKGQLPNIIVSPFNNDRWSKL